MYYNQKKAGDTMEFYKKAFKLLRESKGLTFEEIGKQLKVTKQAVSNWENLNKEDKPRPKRVYELAKILGCSAVDISNLKPEKELLQQRENVLLKDSAVKMSDQPIRQDIPVELLYDEMFFIVMNNWKYLSGAEKGEIIETIQNMVKMKKDYGSKAGDSIKMA